MFYIKVAGLVVAIDNKYLKIREYCRLYLAEPEEKSNVIGVIRTLPEDLERCRQYFRETEHREIDDSAAECDFMQHKLYPLLPAYNAFWLHACVVEVDGEAYAFSAPSGWGKTTHAKLWLKLLGNRARIINGDNPIIRLENGRFTAYGTPFCGKEGWNVNIGVPLKAICYIAHSDSNQLESLEPWEAFGYLVRFSSKYQTKANVDQMLGLYERLVEHVPFYRMNCNMEDEAARISFEGMSGNGSEELQRGGDNLG